MDFESFDSLEDMLTAMDRARKQADLQVQPFQEAIQPGNFYRQPTPYGFTIYGEILKDEEPRPHHLQNYRFARAYSVACPEGELGDVHVSQIERVLSEEEFDYAKQHHWDLE